MHVSQYLRLILAIVCGAALAAPQVAPARLGDLHMVRKRYRDAIDSYQQALKAIPRACHKSAIAHHELGQLEEAEDLYQQALALDPDCPEALNNLGALYFDRSRFDEARDYFESAIDLDPDIPTFHFNLAAALFHDRKYAASQQAFRAAVFLDSDFLDHPDNGQWNLIDRRASRDKDKLYFALSQAYESAGMPQRAASYLDLARQAGFQDDRLHDHGRGLFGWLTSLFR